MKQVKIILITVFLSLVGFNQSIIAQQSIQANRIKMKGGGSGHIYTLSFVLNTSKPKLLDKYCADIPYSISNVVIHSVTHSRNGKTFSGSDLAFNSRNYPTGSGITFPINISNSQADAVEPYITYSFNKKNYTINGPCTVGQTMCTCPQDIDAMAFVENTPKFEVSNPGFNVFDISSPYQHTLGQVISYLIDVKLSGEENFNNNSSSSSDDKNKSSSSANPNSTNNNSYSEKGTQLEELNRKNEQRLKKLRTANSVIDNASRNLFGGTLSENLNKNWTSKKNDNKRKEVLEVEMFDDYKILEINDIIKNELQPITHLFYLKLWKQFFGKPIDIKSEINKYFKEAYSVVSKYKKPSNLGFVPINIPKPKTLYIFDKNFNLKETRITKNADGRAVFDSNKNDIIDADELDNKYDLYSGVDLDDFIKDMSSLVKSWYLVNQNGGINRLEYDDIFEVEINEQNNFKFRQFKSIYFEFNDRSNPKYHGSYGFGTINSNSYYTTMPVFLEQDINLYAKSITIGKFKFTGNVLKEFGDSKKIYSDYIDYYLSKMMQSLKIDNDFFLKTIEEVGPNHSRIKELELKLKAVKEKISYLEKL